MNILIVSQYFHPENFRINDLAVAMVERGHAVTVLTGIPNYPEGTFRQGYGLFRRTRETWRGVEIIRSPMVSRGSARGVRLALNYLSFALGACARSLILVRRPIDVIFTFEVSPVTVGIPALLIRRLKRAPMILWVLDLWPETLQAVGAVKSERLLSLIGRLVASIYRGSDLVLLQSRAFIDSAKRRGAVRTEYFPSWSEDLFLESGECSTTIPEFPDGFRVVFAGNVGESQDFPTIVQAAEIVRTSCPQVRWIVIGDGRMAAWLREAVALRGLEREVRLLGRLPLEMMPACYQKSDALLVALRDEPVFSLTIPGKLQSYLAAGRPVVAMLNGEGGRIVEEAGAGIRCNAGDAHGLAAAVVALAGASHEAREQMGASGREYFRRHFERQMLMDRLENWMSELVAGRQQCNEVSQ